MTATTGTEPTTTSERDFNTSRIIDAPRGHVFHAWTDPEQLRQWFAPRSFTTPSAEVDARPGGSFRIVMRSAEGVDYPIKGVFREVIEPERIIYTDDASEHPAEFLDKLKEERAKQGPGALSLQSLTAVTFEDEDGKTKLSIRTRFASKADRDANVAMGMKDGWSEILDRLEELLAND